MSELQPTSFAWNSGLRKCPQCGSTAVRSSKIVPADSSHRLLLMKPYRCQSCRQRFYSWQWLKRAEAVRAEPEP